jgi:hypothetical protein
VLDFASRLPAARERIARDLGGRGLTRTRVPAYAVRPSPRAASALGALAVAG